MSEHAHSRECWCEVRRYIRIFAVAVLIFAVEIIGGIVSGSLALMADAFHVFMDGGAVIASLVVACLVRKERLDDAYIRSWGVYVQAVMLGFAAFWIFFEAIGRILHPQEIQTMVMLFVATAGGVGNVFQHILLEDDERENNRSITHYALNLHILSDLFQSIAVVIGAVLIALTKQQWIDPMLSCAVACLMLFWAVRLVCKT